MSATLVKILEGGGRRWRERWACTVAFSLACQLFDGTTEHVDDGACRGMGEDGVVLVSGARELQGCASSVV